MFSKLALNDLKLVLPTFGTCPADRGRLPDDISVSESYCTENKVKFGEQCFVYISNLKETNFYKR